VDGGGIFGGKAGGLGSSEALARGLVLVIVNPIPGREERNADHYLEGGNPLQQPRDALLEDILVVGGRCADQMRQRVQRTARQRRTSPRCSR
jgi:processive 1,2-diacylglycerol beta-glucosyltransferase